jgi:hypothetical protein
MKYKKLNSEQIITLNDYPVYSNEVLSNYYAQCMLGEKLPFVPVIDKKIVKENLNKILLEKFKIFEEENPLAEYFMLDGSHRTTALTLAKSKIMGIVYEKDEDIIEAKKLIETGQMVRNGTLEKSLKENCEILNNHFLKKQYFMTVKQKTEKMIDEGIVPEDLMK